MIKYFCDKCGEEYKPTPEELVNGRFPLCDKCLKLRDKDSIVLGRKIDKLNEIFEKSWRDYTN